MRRTLTASSLAALLLVVITMQQVVLGFCECAQSYFAVTCHCEDMVKAGDDCCGSCDAEEHSEEAPCDDCQTSVSLDPGDFQWSALEEPVAHFSVTLIDLPSPLAVMWPSSLPLRDQVVSSRGSPPGDVPLFLRDSVFRL